MKAGVSAVRPTFRGLPSAISKAFMPMRREARSVMRRVARASRPPSGPTVIVSCLTYCKPRSSGQSMYVRGIRRTRHSVFSRTTTRSTDGFSLGSFGTLHTVSSQADRYMKYAYGEDRPYVCVEVEGLAQGDDGGSVSGHFVGRRAVGRMSSQRRSGITSSRVAPNCSKERAVAFRLQSTESEV